MLTQDATRLSTQISFTRRNFRRGLQVALLASLVTFVSAPAACAGTWHAQGQVRFSDGTPAAGATVTLSTVSGGVASAQADSSGNYSVQLNDSSNANSALLRATSGSCNSPTQQIFAEDITSSLTISGTPGNC